MPDQRRASQQRDTAETKIGLELNIDGSGDSEIATGVPFFDHNADAVRTAQPLRLEGEKPTATSTSTTTTP